MSFHANYRIARFNSKSTQSVKIIFISDTYESVWSLRTFPYNNIRDLMCSGGMRACKEIPGIKFRGKGFSESEGCKKKVDIYS